MKKALPIGNDSFRIVRERDFYYVDKSLLIKDFIESRDTVALVTRPRRFGKSLNMTMLREFFDITKDSSEIFNGLAIMDTEYAGQINSRPVIYFTFKDCKGNTPDLLLFKIGNTVLKEYEKYYDELIKDSAHDQNSKYHDFFMIYKKLRERSIDLKFLEISIETLEKTVSSYYQTEPIVLIDEYDQPMICSVEYGYHDELKLFFSGLFGSALKGQEYMYQAFLTGIQRVVKESIFSQLNNISVYTVLDEQYSGYFGLDAGETEELLAYYDLPLDEGVKAKYNGYIFGSTEIYNPWSVLNYAKKGKLENYWINTSTNALVHTSINAANGNFHKSFDKLVSEEVVTVSVDLGCSFIELKNNHTLWGLLINAGYVTVVERLSENRMRVRIPNGEVKSEFQKIVTERANLDSVDLDVMFQCLMAKEMDGFLDIYSELVISCTSYFDAKENAYHMLFLGMCVTLNKIYKITSNAEAGHGRSDIRMESLSAERPHIVIEFKQGGDIDALKEEALQQILDNEYHAGLKGEVLCVGVAHDKKRCAVAHKTVIAS